MKFLLDENIPYSFCGELTKAGFEARHVNDVGLKATDDNDIVSFAAKSSEIIVTYDLDFSRIISQQKVKSISLITFRVTNLNAVSFLKLFTEVINSCEKDLITGAMIVVDDDRIRVRILPVLKRK